MINFAQQYLEQVTRLIPEHKFHRFLEIGKAPNVEPFTPDEQARVNTLLKRIDPKAKHCFANCQRSIMLYGLPFHYVEGFYAPADLPIAVEHAWLTLNGKLVEITPNVKAGDYFGVEINPATLIEFLYETQKHGPITDDMETGWKYTKRVLGLSPDLSIGVCTRV